MTEAQLKDLKRQWDDAKSVLGNAERKEAAAREAYQAAMCERFAEDMAKKGAVIGAKVRITRSWRGPTDPRIVTGAKWEYGEPALTLARIKADGTASAAACSDTITQRTTFEVLE